MHKLTALALSVTVTGGCLIGGDDQAANQIGNINYATSSKLFGLHEPDTDGAALMPSGGWVVYNYKLTDGPQPIAPNLGALIRINNGYDPDGTLPCYGKYGEFAISVATFVGKVPGGHSWIIGNEPNLSAEWPTCGKDKERITPAHYAEAFRAARDAIHGVAGHASDQVIVAGVGQWNKEIGFNSVQYYQMVLDALGDGAVDGIAIHAYTRGAVIDQVNKDYIDPKQDLHLQGGFRIYRDYLNATPHWARKLPVYITETNQNGEWDKSNTGWIQAVYGEINDWNFGADKDQHQKIQAVAMYRWYGGATAQFNMRGVDGAKQDFTDAVAEGYGSPEAAPPAEPTGNTCSTEAGLDAQPINDEYKFAISGSIYQAWKKQGLAVFGYPLTNARKLVNSSGKYVCSQLFERTRIELPLDDQGNTTKDASGNTSVTLGLLGNERMPRDLDKLNDGTRH